MRLRIAGGTIVCDGRRERADVLLEGGLIAAVGEVDETGATVVDAGGCSLDTNTCSYSDRTDSAAFVAAQRRYSCTSSAIRSRSSSLSTLANGGLSGR